MAAWCNGTTEQSKQFHDGKVAIAILLTVTTRAHR